MRALWILLLFSLALEKAKAQFSAIDSSLFLQFASTGIQELKKQKSKAVGLSQGYYLVKWKSAPPKDNISGCMTVRVFSNLRAIILVSSALEFSEAVTSLDYLVAVNDNWKLPPTYAIDEVTKFKCRWLVRVIDEKKFLDGLKSFHTSQVEQGNESNAFVLSVDRSDDILAILHSPLVIFLQPLLALPKEELLINGFDISTNRINLVHQKYPTLDGAGLTAAVKENKFDTTDIDFKGRYVSTGLSSNILTGHASIMATMIGGGGNSYYLGKGVAPNSGLSSTNFAQLLPAPDAVYNQFHISVENHSYGTAIENFYGADAAAYDVSVSNNPTLIHVFSSGNSGNASSSSGIYSGVPGFANLTGSFKMAKNIITVGATDSFANVEQLSSRGPAFDGRIKPDLVAFGQDGSSGAAALVSGSALLIQQAYKIQHHDSLPPAALVRACLINSTDEVGGPGPDYVSGFGSLNIYNAVRTITEGRYFLNIISDKHSQIIPLNIPSGIRQIRITLAYTDLPAQANTFKALTNDVDVELFQISNGQSWKPWVLNSSPNKDSLLLPATRKRDSLNNVEQITIDSPAAGQYQLHVNGFNITNASQAYAIAYQIDTVDLFEWNFPTKNDPVIAGNSSVARWNETVDGPGKLEFSGDRGLTWIQLSSNVDLDKKYVRWQAPDSFSTGLLRMTINGKTYTTDTFAISPDIQMQVGFNCEDSVLLTWNKIVGADHYELYALSSKFLVPAALLSDTFFVFSKNSIASKHFTIAPIKGSLEGNKAFTIDYETQGVDCYIKNFLAQLNGDKATIFLELATLYRLKQITIQRDSGTDYLSLQTLSNLTQLNFQFDNLELHQGVNRFRVKLSRTDGKIIFSRIEIIYYSGKNDFIIYPNPALVNGGFTILRKDLENATMVLSDLYGRRIMRLPLEDIITTIRTSSLQSGVYFISIFDKNGKRKYIQKLIIQ